MADRSNIRLSMRKLYLFSGAFLAILLGACSSNSGGGASQNSQPSSSAAPPEVFIPVTLSLDSQTYEAADDPLPFAVIAEFSEPPTAISASDLNVGSNAQVLFLSPLNNGRTYGFTVKPDSSNQPVEVVLPKGTVRFGNVRNAESNQLIVNPVDTIEPYASFRGEIKSFGTDQSIDQIAVDITINEAANALRIDDFELQSAAITDFNQIDERNYQLTLQNTRQGSEIQLRLPAGALMDAFGNQSTDSETLSFPSTPQAPEVVVDLSVSTANGNLVFAWEESRNTTDYQLVTRRETHQEWQVVAEIPDSAAPHSYELKVVNTLDQVRREYALRSCNSAGCSENSPIAINEHLWAISKYIKAPRSHDGHAFGSNVAISGDGTVMAISSENDATISDDPFDDQSEALYRSGAVYMYRKVDDVWQMVQFIQAEDRSTRDAFGFSLALNEDGSVLVVGSPDNDLASSDIDANRGAVYIYRLNADAWEFESKLISGSVYQRQWFGFDSVIDRTGSFIAVSAPGLYSAATGTAGAGAVFTYEYTGDGWRRNDRIDSPVLGENFNFGRRLVLNGAANTLVVGMPRGDVEAVPEDEYSRQTGMAFVYRKQDEDWTFTQTIQPPSIQSGVNFGDSLAIDNDGSLLVIGAPGEDLNGGTFESAGSVHSYSLVADEYQLSHTLRPTNPVDYIEFGRSLALSDDGARLALVATEYSEWAAGFYTQQSPNDNRPWSTPSILLFDRNNNSWQFSTFIKGYTRGYDTLAADMDLNTLVYGAYHDHLLLDGNYFLGELDVTSAATANLVGAVFVFD